MSLTREPASHPNLGAIEFTGPETREFLQGQLTCDMQNLAVGCWTWGGYLTPKGRLLATFVAAAVDDERCILVMDEDLIDAALKKFKMYLLRAKTKPAKLAAQWTAALEGTESEPDFRFEASGDSSMAIPLGHGLTLRCDGAERDRASEQPFFAACAELGLPWLSGALQDKLTVHMVSLDLAGGVNFDKGCYVGQEIVIRSHHRGQIKKRAFVVAGDGAAPMAGQDILSAAHGGQAAGQIVYCAARDAGFVGLASIRKDAVADRLELENGVEISAAPPPYGLLDPKFETG